jgi:hypothetical protein
LLLLWTLHLYLLITAVDEGDVEVQLPTHSPLQGLSGQHHLAYLVLLALLEVKGLIGQANLAPLHAVPFLAMLQAEASTDIQQANILHHREVLPLPKHRALFRGGSLRIKNICSLGQSFRAIQEAKNLGELLFYF